MSTRVRRLAQPVPDHDMDQLLREGPEGPGRGTIVWDTGTYTLLAGRTEARTAAEALDVGHLKVVLDGHKLRGGFALTRTGLPPASAGKPTMIVEDLSVKNRYFLDDHGKAWVPARHTRVTKGTPGR